MAVDLQEMAPIEGVKQLQVQTDSSTVVGRDLVVLQRLFTASCCVRPARLFLASHCHSDRFCGGDR